MVYAIGNMVAPKFGIFISILKERKSYKKTLAKREGSIPLGCLKPHLLSLTTLPGEAGWYGQYPCLDAWTDSDSVSSGCQQA